MVWIRLAQASDPLACLLQPETVSVAFSACLESQACRTTYYITADMAPDRRTFEVLWTRHIHDRASHAIDTQAFYDGMESLCAPSFAAGGAETVTPLVQAMLVASKPFCGVNEAYELDVGCRCASGAVCPGSVDADGVGVRTSDRVFVRILGGVLLATVVVGGIMLLSRTQKTQSALEQLGSKNE